MSLFKQFRKQEELEFKGEKFTLFEPSALDRTLHLQRVEKMSEDSTFEKDGKGNTLITLEVLKANLESSVDLIAICLAPNYENVSLDEVRADILANANKDFVNAFYPVAESLSYPTAPEDTDSPKPDRDLDSVTD